MRRERTFRVVGGGTGGHAAVAVAVADEARAQGARAIVVADDGAVLARMAPHHDTALVDAAGVARERTARARLSRLAVPWHVLHACHDARVLVDDVRPEAVIALGGAAAGVVALAAARRGVNVVVHEQNAAVGVGNAIAATVATARAAAFREARFDDGEPAVPVPVPVRAAFAPSLPPRARRVVVIGGSGGSARLNEAVSAALPRLQRAGVTGLWLGVTADDPEPRRQRGGLERLPWTSDVAAAMRDADLVITVGGAITLAEAAAVGRPCVVLPRRDVASDHQRKNAHALSARGAIALTTRAGLADDVLTVLADERRHATLAANLARWQRATTSPAAALLALALSPALAAPRAAAE